MLITIEGASYTGKTTQVALLSAALIENGCTVQTLTESSTPLIREILSNPLPNEEDHRTELAMLFAAQRLRFSRTTIEPALKTGHVLMDRYVHSSLVYQSRSEADMIRISSLNERIVQPDLVVYLRTEQPHMLASRLKKDFRPWSVVPSSQSYSQLDNAYSTAFKVLQPKRLIILEAIQDELLLHENIVAAVNANLY
jgi:dTMP kinase